MLLDLAISEHAGSVSYYPHLGTSDHIAIFVGFQMSLHVPSSSPTRKVYHWKSAPWRHLCGHFCQVQWGFLKSKPIPDAIDTFVNILTMAHDRYVSSTLPTIKRPTVWWDHYCQRTSQRKLHAWRRRDWLAYRDSVLTLLLKGLRLSPIVFIKDHFIPSCSQDLQIVCGGILPGISVDCLKLVIDLPLMLIVLLLILLANYHCLLILIPVCPLLSRECVNE